MFKKSKAFLCFALILMLLVSVAGCGKTEPAAPAAPGTPAPSQETITWTLQSVWQSGFYLYDLLEDFADEVTELSAGRLVIDVYPGGSIVPAMDVLDAAQAGTIDVAHGSEVLWPGMFPAATFFGSFPMTFDPFMFLTWMYERGGLEMLHRGYESIGITTKVLPMNTIDSEILAWSHRPLSHMDDWHGLKYRTIGWWGEILREAGVSVTSLAPAEIFPSLERRVVDAVEYSTPINDLRAGIHDLATYFTGPGVHQPFTSMKIYINEDSWNELPNDLKRLVEVVARGYAYTTWSNEVSESIDALKVFLADGKIPTYMNEEAQVELRQITWDLLDSKAKDDAFFAEVWTSVQEFYEEYLQYDDFLRMVKDSPKNPLVEK